VLDGDIATVGITDHAQEQLGDLVHIELPELERSVAEGESCAVVESVKAASDIYAPIAGKVVEVNETIAEDPSIVNSDAEGEGWFFRLELDDPATSNSFWIKTATTSTWRHCKHGRSGRTGGA